jgi:NAD(P)-dependent dehydrogenase (short-subunit alcohol dehydrogenase family)
VALVTGGSRGIGRATSLLFARHGAKVVIGDVDSAGEEIAETIKQDDGEAIFVQSDVRTESDVKDLIATVVKTYGGLHCAFNNAGILPTTALLADTDASVFDSVLAVDLKGVFLCMKYEIQLMLQHGGGAIVNNASIAGMIADPGISAYVAAKHGVIGMSKAAAIEYASQGIASMRWRQAW